MTSTAPSRADWTSSAIDGRCFWSAICCWDGLKTAPKIAQLLSAYGQALESAATGNASVASALAKGQKDGARILKGA